VSAQAEEAQHSNDHDNQTHDIDNAVHIVLSLKLKKKRMVHTVVRRLDRTAHGCTTTIHTVAKAC